MRQRRQRVQRERPSGITTTIVRSAETIDFDAWCERYVADCLAVLRTAGELTEAA